MKCQLCGHLIENHHHKGFAVDFCWHCDCEGGDVYPKLKTLVEEDMADNSKPSFKGLPYKWSDCPHCVTTKHGDEVSHEPNCPKSVIAGMKESPIFEIIQDHQHIRIYANGVVEGLEGDGRIINHIPLVMRLEYMGYFSSPKAVAFGKASAANRDWLNAHIGEYSGQWVALKDGQLLGTSESLDMLVASVSKEHGIVFPSREVMLTSGY